jgi:5-(carboxyamino)imidazole ribonucleotide synthase
MKKIGILGGGQLGRMLLQAAANYPAETHVMELDPECPSADLCRHFTCGDIKDFDAVMRFGSNLDVITIEIEHVNTDALEALEASGVTVIPKPSSLRILQDKILQKQFYRDHEIPSSDFVITSAKEDLILNRDFLPAVHKLAKGGYDGRGVQIIKTEKDIQNGFDAPSILEKAVDIKMEISIIIGINEHGDYRIFPTVEMIFDPVLNLVSYQISPARISKEMEQVAQAMALTTVRALGSPGIFAVECFVDKNDNVLVNEIAPRVHNSGHQTIESCYSSQFDMLWRILLDLPLGNTDLISPAGMVNIVGESEHSGPVTYEGIDKVLDMRNTFLHIYGKKETRPGRKMGHVSLLADDINTISDQCVEIRNILKAKT